MIPINPSAEEREAYVQNILAAFRAASYDQYRQGIGWYTTAHDLANMISEGDVETGAGVIAALSANKSWSENQRLARKAIDTGTPVGHVGDALGKASRILAGADPSEVLPMSAKTGHFYRCILDPTDPDAVVIDRHAHDIAVGQVYGNQERGLSTPKRYAILAHSYREAAARMGTVLPQQVQAITWVAQVERLAGTSTRAKNRKG